MVNLTFYFVSNKNLLIFIFIVCMSLIVAVNKTRFYLFYFYQSG